MRALLAGIHGTISLLYISYLCTGINVIACSRLSNVTFSSGLAKYGSLDNHMRALLVWRDEEQASKAVYILNLCSGSPTFNALLKTEGRALDSEGKGHL